MKFRGIITDKGKLEFTGSRAWVSETIKGMKPGDVDIEIKAHVNKRSLPQNRYYWSVVVGLVFEGLKDAGFDDVRKHEDAHEIIKEMFFKKVLWSDDKGNLETTVSTTKYSPKEFAEKMEQISRWAFEFLGTTIPPPESQAALNI